MICYMFAYKHFYLIQIISLHSQGQVDVISEHAVSKQLTNGPDANTDEQKKAPCASTETTPNGESDVVNPTVVNGLS